MTETTSVTTVVVGDHLPWPDDSSGFEKGPFDPAVIHYGTTRTPCVIRKISSLGVTIESTLATALGEKVSVELASGQRAHGKIAWTGRGELGVRFDESIDVLALLNRKLVSQDRERRTVPRLEVRCPVHVKCGEHFWTATLRNISARGLQIQANELPAMGTYVSLFIEGLNIPPGEIVWRKDKLAGIEIFEELNWSSLIPWVRDLVRQGAN